MLPKDELQYMALVLVDTADDIDTIYPFQANALRNMAKAIEAFLHEAKATA